MTVESETAESDTGPPIGLFAPRKSRPPRRNRRLCPQSTTPTTIHNFDDVVVPHLDAALRLARWQMRNEHDAEDVVQEASLRALRYFGTFSGGNGRAWFLKIVRNTCWSWRGQDTQPLSDPFDEDEHSGAHSPSDPETLLLQTDDVASIDQAMRALPDRFRKLLVLRELEGLSYRELAEAMRIPMGTVMSTLSRARQALRAAMSAARPSSPNSNQEGTEHEEHQHEQPINLRRPPINRPARRTRPGSHRHAASDRSGADRYAACAD